jgi:predicted RNA methylase
VSRTRLTVEPVPVWADAARLLAPASLAFCEREALDGGHERLTLELPMEDAARVAARLRGVGLDGQALQVTLDPVPSRARTREARLADARARREISPGFTWPGARATGEGRFSLTPEALALSLGRLAAGRSVLDACCGSGGNTIGFARAGCQVTALELDGERLAEARHNAAIYKVAERIQFIQADAREVVPSGRADILFIDPPWGEQYDKQATDRASFPLLSALLAGDTAGYGELWLKLPSSFRVASIEGASARAFFGESPGDRHRVKFVLVQTKR